MHDEVAPTVTELYVAAITHLDVGFTDVAGAVKERYLHRHIPQAIELAERFSSDPRGYHWTMGAWLVRSFLAEMSTADRRRLERAVAEGWISWHAMPFTLSSELADRSLLEYGLSYSQALDRRFGVTTIAAKVTDVPGHTRGIIAPLVDAGVRFLHIGTNPGCRPAEVPPLFRWRNGDGAEVIVAYNALEYGGLVTIPGSSTALYIASTLDNIGPHTQREIETCYTELADRFPGAAIRATSLNRFAEVVQEHGDRLPIVTEEIGDTWIHGAGSDPKKMYWFKELSRLRERWSTDGTATAYPEFYRELSDALLLVAEHTWGLDIKTHLNDRTHWHRDEFLPMLATTLFRRAALSWRDERAYIVDLVQGDATVHPYVEVARRLAPPPTDFEAVDFKEPGVFRDIILANDTLEVRFDPHSGAAIRFVHRDTGRVRELSFGACRYEIYGEDDYRAYLSQYGAYGADTVRRLPWAGEDLAKPGYPLESVDDAVFPFRLGGVAQTTEAGVPALFLHLHSTARGEHAYGCPSEMFLRYRLRRTTLECTLHWPQKTASRLSEALWLDCGVAAGADDEWRIRKSGEWIDPRRVVRGGNRLLHAAEAIEVGGDRDTVIVSSPHAPLVRVQDGTILQASNEPATDPRAMSINLYNNLWSTNYPQWYGEDATFAFRLEWRSTPGDHKG